MNLCAEEIISLNGQNFANSMFPGAAKCSNGDIVLIAVEGSDFESSDQQMIQFRSTDNGKSWNYEAAILPDFKNIESQLPYTGCAKPAVCPDNSLVAVGYGFHRDRADMGLSDYAEEYKKFPPCTNFSFKSTDNGKSWHEAKIIRHEYDGMEISGPALALPDGKLLFFAAPFVLNADKQQGFAFESTDDGNSWTKISTFFDSKSIAPWEVRSVRLDSGRIILVMWAFDLAKSQHLANHIVYSDDEGRTWSKPVDTTLRGQASNLLLHDGKLGVIQARREGANAGIYLNDIKIDENDKVTTSEDICLWSASNMANSGTRIEEQFASLKFGQPSALSLNDGAYMLIFWSCINGIYSVKTMRFTLN